MASQAATEVNSRLAQLQMRFQQKQEQERENRRIQMVESKQSSNKDETVGKKRIGNGKVRQMFDERRRGAGIDRANPLKPITSATVLSQPVNRQVSGSINKALPTKNSNENAVRNRPTPGVQAKYPSKRSPNGNADTITKEMSSLSLGMRSPDNRSNNMNNDVMGRAKSFNNLKLNPVVTKKSPPPATASAHAPSSTPTTKRSPNASHAVRKTPPPRPNSKPRTAQSTAAHKKTPPRGTSGNMSANMQGGRSQTSTDMNSVNMALCRFCNRHFNTERLAKHEKICEKMVHTNRKIFDAASHRLRGTGAEKYIQKAQRNSGNAKSAYSSAAAVTGMTASLKKNNWRKKHEEFISAIRAAKEVQAHLARGGKLSDLPPPPPSDTSDYIQCPHCLRRFNESAAERHIPRCANMIHNKPKLAQTPKKR